MNLALLRLIQRIFQLEHHDHSKTLIALQSLTRMMSTNADILAAFERRITKLEERR